MANFLTTSFSHTYAGKEILTEIFYKPSETGDSIFENYKVMDVPGHKANVYIPNTLDNILKKYTDCGISESGSVTISDRTIEVVRVGGKVSECIEAFWQTVLDESAKRGVMRDDITGTLIEEIALNVIKEAVKRDVSKIQWFADDNETSNKYDHFDGWVTIMLNGTATNGYNLDLDGTAYQSGGVLVANGAYNAMKKLYENQSMPFRQMARNMKKFYVTATVEDNLLTTYEALGTDSGLNRLINGEERLTFRGIPVYVVPGWDTALADSDNPCSSTIGDNLIVLTTPQNLIVGSNVSSPESEFRVWFDQDTEKWYYRTKFKLGAQIMHMSLNHIAY
jgi:hypothetical protein